MEGLVVDFAIAVDAGKPHHLRQDPENWCWTLALVRFIAEADPKLI